MAPLSKIQYEVWSRPFPPYNSFFGGSGVDYPTALAFSTAMNLPPEAIQRFTLDEQNNILCRIDRNYILNSSALSNYAGAGKTLRNFIIDLDGNLTGAQTRAITSQPNLKMLLPGLLVWGYQFNGQNPPGPNLVYIPNCTTGTQYVFHDWKNGLNRLYAPVLDNTTGFTQFLQYYNQNLNANKKHVLYLNNAIATHPRVLDAVSRGATLRIVTNFDLPNKVTDLVVLKVGAKHVQLGFTTPSAVGLNPIDFYEIWREEVNRFDIEDRYLPSDEEITAPNQFVKNFKKGTKYRLQLYTCDTMYNGSGMAQDPDDRAESDVIYFETLAQDFFITENQVFTNKVKIKIEDYATINSDYTITSLRVYVGGILNRTTTKSEFVETTATLATATEYEISISLITTEVGEIISDVIKATTL